MRIAIFTDTFPPEINGVATSSVTLYNILKKNGHTVYVVTTNPYSDKVIIDGDIIRVPGVTVKAIYQYRMAGIFYRSAFRLIKNLNLDVAHIQTEFGVAIFGRIACRRLGIPVVYTYHTMYEDYTYYITKGHFDRIARAFVRSVTKRYARGSSEFITPSEKTKNYQRSIGVDAYINIIPTGFDFYRFLPENQNQAELIKYKKEHDLEGYFIFLFLGRVAQEKSIDTCLKAFFTFCAQHPEVKAKFMVCGDGPHLPELLDLVTDHGFQDRVIFTGKIRPGDVGFFYNLGNTFVCASVTETQGLTYMEAMASHIPVLVRYDDTLAQLIHDDHNGFFFTDMADLSEKMYEMYRLTPHKVQEITRAAFASLGDYTIDKFYERILGVYQRAVRNFW